jgi:hypothetical protein
MTCETVTLPSGYRAIVCSSRSRKRCRVCGAKAALLCDWKVAKKSSGTCDAPLCHRCAETPAPDKDLCPTHAGAYRRWLGARTDQPKEAFS